MAKTKIFRTFTQNLPTISEKFFFLTKTYQEFPEALITHEFYKTQKRFPEFYNFLKFSENLETILVDVRFQFCLAAESIWQDGAILPDDQPIKLRESREG